MHNSQSNPNWLQSSSFFSRFHSQRTPSAGVYTTARPHRSRSVGVADLNQHDPQDPPRRRNGLGWMLSKARRQHIRRWVTEGECTTSPPDPGIQTRKSITVIRRQSRNTSIPESILSSGFTRMSLDTTDVTEPYYLFTRTENEAERIELKNDLVKLAFHDEFPTPVDFASLENGRVLDIGCGPGSWCLDLAADFPELEIIGLDFQESMFPDAGTIPPNCIFIRYNVLMGLGQFEDKSIDYCHIRFMNLSLTVRQYAQVVKDCWRVLKPGGYLEMMEMDMMIYSPGPTMEQLNEQVVDAAQSRGFKPRLARHLNMFVPGDASCRIERYRSLPIGLWGGRLGVLFRDDLIHMLVNSRDAVLEHLGTFGERNFDTDIELVNQEMEEYQSYSNFHLMIAQKPL
ncbi:S-adenosyl-L-methionine-dependent methyltransferase [Phycomyces nitens]|nr:S-adenosyl-L-methionine-dependent methyltransferase [Phycomyces nitens]